MGSAEVSPNAGTRREYRARDTTGTCRSPAGESRLLKSRPSIFGPQTDAHERKFSLGVLADGGWSPRRQHVLARHDESLDLGDNHISIVPAAFRMLRNWEVERHAHAHAHTRKPPCRRRSSCSLQVSSRMLPRLQLAGGRVMLDRVPCSRRARGCPNDANANPRTKLRIQRIWRTAGR